MAKYVYDNFTDSLIVSSKKNSDKVKGSAVLGDIVIDLTKQGKVVGLEIKHFSDFIKRFNLKKKVEDISAANLSVTYKVNSIIIWVYLKFGKEKEQRLPIYISTETPKMAMT